jgi:Zn finger protein HypA/HybF involved in hydrogenase expression
MEYAYCNNDDCENHKWWLQKPPESYSGGGPKCPECGTTKVTIGDGESGGETAPAESGETPRSEQPTEGGTTARPARTDQQGGAAPPADPADRQQAVEAGQRTAELALSVAGSGGSPEAEADATEKTLTAVGSALATVGQRVAERKRQNAQRAKQTDQSAIETVEDFVTCPECETQITDLPPVGDEFQCPGCSVVLRNTGQ